MLNQKRPAWALNSANAQNESIRNLPTQKDNLAESQTVRAWGNPMGWYPGERYVNNDVRPGSINMLGLPALTQVDEITNNRYPTNEDLQRTMAYKHQC